MNEKKSFTAAILKVTGRHLLITPENNLKKGDYVISFYPFKKVDPKGIYVFVVPADGETQSHTKQHLFLVKRVTVTWERQMFDTHNMEVRRQIAAMTEILKNYIHNHHETN